MQFFCMVHMHGDHGAICWILCPTEILLRWGESARKWGIIPTSNYQSLSVRMQALKLAKCWIKRKKPFHPISAFKKTLCFLIPRYFFITASHLHLHFETGNPMRRRMSMSQMLVVTSCCIRFVMMRVLELQLATWTFRKMGGIAWWWFPWRKEDSLFNLQGLGEVG